MKKKWITFDLDGTLMQNPFGKWVFPEIEEFARDKYGHKLTIVSDLVKEHRKRMNEGQIVAAYDWDEIVQSVLKRYGIKHRIDVEELVQKHAYPPKVYLLEENIIDAMLELRKQGFNLAAVTNGFEKYQKPVMDMLGLTTIFDSIITPEKVGFGKPTISIVNSLNNNHNVMIAHVGDRLDHDIVLANELGVISILLDLDMPDFMRKLKPSERAKEEEYQKWLHEKWKMETGNERIPHHAIPTWIIYSIKEINQKSLMNN